MKSGRYVHFVASHHNGHRMSGVITVDPYDSPVMVHEQIQFAFLSKFNMQQHTSESVVVEKMVVIE